MITPLIPLAFQFRSAGLWFQLKDNDVYGVRLRDGRIGYCSVMGHSGSHFGLGLYIGCSGWNSYLDLCVMNDCINEIEIQQTSSTLDFILCDYFDKRDIPPSKDKRSILAYASKHKILTTGTAAVPTFTRFSPNLSPWTISLQSDADAMEDALHASIALALLLERIPKENLGFHSDGIRYSDRPDQEIPLLIHDGDNWKIERTSLPGRTPVTYPTPDFNHPEICMQIAYLKPHSNLECRQFVVNAPVMDAEIPYLPFVTMAVDGNSGHVTITQITRDSPSMAEDQILDLSLKIVNMGYRPTRIFVQDDRTQALLKNFCQKTGIPLQRVSRLKHTQDAWNSLSKYLSDKKTD